MTGKKKKRRKKETLSDSTKRQGGHKRKSKKNKRLDLRANEHFEIKQEQHDTNLDRNQ